MFTYLLPPLTIVALHCLLRKVSTSSPQIHQPRNSSPKLPLSLSENSPTSSKPLLTRVLAPIALNPHCHPPCNGPRCKTFPIHNPANSFSSSCTNLTYPITTHADCKSMNLIYQLQCTECNAMDQELDTKLKGFPVPHPRGL